MKKHIAHKLRGADGEPLECWCTERIVCPNCVQANVNADKKIFIEREEAGKLLISRIRKRGVKKLSLELEMDERDLKRYLSQGNFPTLILEKFMQIASDK